MQGTYTRATMGEAAMGEAKAGQRMADQGKFNQDYLDPIYFPEILGLADSAVAMDFLLTKKWGVRHAAYALVECATPEARTIVRRQLEEGLAMHDEIADLMMEKSWLHPYNVPEQHKLDMKMAETTMQIAQMDLFPKTTTMRRKDV